MPVDLSIRLPRDASASRVARRAVEDHIGAALDDRRLDELKLVVSELVNNAVIHGAGAISLSLKVDGTVVRGEVIDEGGGFEREVRELGADEIGGRGLRIVDVLAGRWGIHDGTTHVWFEVGPEDGAGPAGPAVGEGQRPDDLS